MMLNVTEEQSVNGALNICTQGAMGAARFGGWIFKHKDLIKNLFIKKDTALLEDACSYYRGGCVANSSSPEMQTLINDLRGSKFTRADGNFFFLGDKSDLSYFWKKIDNKNNTVLYRSLVDSIADDKIKRGTISALTQAVQKGLLTYDGQVYALAPKGKEAILDPGFVANRLKGEEVFCEKAAQALKEQAEKVYVFAEAGKEPVEYRLYGSIKDGMGGEQLKLFSEKDGELMLPQEARGVILFSDKEQGEAFIKENPEKVAEMQKYVTLQRVAKDREFNRAGSYVTSFTDEGEKYAISLGNSYERLMLPKSDAARLEDGSLSVNIYADKEYTVITADRAYNVTGDAAKEMLDKGVGAVKETAATTASVAANTAANAIDGAATAYPPAKAVTATLNVIYKAVQGTASATKTVSSSVQKL